VLASAGLTVNRSLLPEDDPLNFAPRFQAPTLIEGARFDFLLPIETSQRPLLRLLGAPEKDKRLIIWDRGHGDVEPMFQAIIKETLDWFDRYLGPVKR
jgi:hypothetical protein